VLRLRRRRHPGCGGRCHPSRHRRRTGRPVVRERTRGALSRRGVGSAGRRV
jgi:hypothetical protein